MTQHYIELGNCCNDCVQVIANGDYSGIDYYCKDEAEREARIAEIDAGIEREPGYLIIGEENGFSWDRCDICGALPGDRHIYGALVEGEAPKDEWIARGGAMQGWNND